MEFLVKGYSFSTIQNFKKQLDDLDSSKLTFSFFHGRRFCLVDKNHQQHFFNFKDLVGAVENALKYKEVSDSDNRDLVDLLSSFNHVWRRAGYNEYISDAKISDKFRNIIKSENFLVRWITQVKHYLTTDSSRRKIEQLLFKIRPRANLFTQLQNMSGVLKKIEAADPIQAAKISIKIECDQEKLAKDYLFEPSAASFDQALESLLSTIDQEAKEWMKDKGQDPFDPLCFLPWEGELRGKSGQFYWARHQGYTSLTPKYDRSDWVRQQRELLGQS